MTLYVVPQPDPPAGEDWIATVPGQYVWDIVGITATLVTTNQPTYVLKDSAPAGNDGLYGGGTPVFETPLITGGLAFAVDTPPPGPQAGVFTGILDWTAAWSVEMWTKQPNGPGGWPMLTAPDDYTNPGTDEVQINNINGTTVAVTHFDGVIFSSWVTVGNPYPPDGEGHYVVVTYDGAGTVAIYIDGAATVVTPPFPPAVITATPQSVWPGDTPFFGGIRTPNVVDEYAFYAFALDAGTIDAHYQRRTNLQTYSDAVLNDGAVTFWQFDDVVSTDIPQVELEITNGTTPVQEIPTGFLTFFALGPFNYSWQPNLNSSTQTPDGTTTTVAIPQLTLPAGYTVGTRTVDLAADSQWTDIVVWWDDTYQQTTVDLPEYEYPPGALLRWRPPKLQP